MSAHILIFLVPVMLTHVLNIQLTSEWHLNQNMCSQTMACITKLLCEIAALLRYYAALSGNYFLSFQDTLSVPPSKVTKSKRENRVWLKLQDTIFFFGACTSSNFLNKAWYFRSQFCFHFQAKNLLTWWFPYIALFIISEHLRNSTLLRNAPENRSSPRVVTGKLLLQN